MRNMKKAKSIRFAIDLLDTRGYITFYSHDEPPVSGEMPETPQGQQQEPAAQAKEEPAPAAAPKQGNPVLLIGGLCAVAGIAICLIAASRAKKNKKYKGRH